MKTAIYTERGAARDVIKFADVEAPRPGPGEVTVKIQASGINPSDVKTRAGSSGPMTVTRTVPHCDGAGVISAVGSGVPERRIGERVWLFNVNRTADGTGQGERGTAAETIAVEAGLAVPLVEGVSFATAACLGVPAMTAHRCVMADGPVRGQTVLVTGGAGAVGAMAIQIAKWGGARVIATVSSEEKAAAARADGADGVVNYKTENVAERVLALNDGQRIGRIVDVDFAAHIELATQILKPSGGIGMYASMSNRTPAIPTYAFMLLNAKVDFVLVYSMSDAAKQASFRDIETMLREGALKPRIARTFGLDQIIEAHELQEQGTHIGNMVLTLD